MGAFISKLRGKRGEKKHLFNLTTVSHSGYRSEEIENVSVNSTILPNKNVNNHSVIILVVAKIVHHRSALNSNINNNAGAKMTRGPDFILQNFFFFHNDPKFKFQRILPLLQTNHEIMSMFLLLLLFVSGNLSITYLLSLTVYIDI